MQCHTNVILYVSLFLSPLPCSLSLSPPPPPPPPRPTPLTNSFIGELLSPTKDASSGQSHLLVAPNGSLHPSRSMSHDLKDQASGILQVPTFGFPTSPKTGAFEFESINQSSDSSNLLLKVGSKESIHSTSSQ